MIETITKNNSRNVMRNVFLKYALCLSLFFYIKSNVNAVPACGTPTNQDFNSFTDDNYAPSITYDCMTYYTSDGAAYVDAITNSITGSPLFSGNALVLYNDNPGGYAGFKSANLSSNFKLSSFVADFYGHSSGNISEILSIVGYDNGTEVVRVNNFSVISSGTYGSGNAAISYVHNSYNNSGSNSGTLTFGTDWQNVDEVRFIATDPKPNNWLFICVDNMKFEAPVTPCNAPSSLSSNITNVSCKGGSNGVIDLTVGAGDTPFSYSWSGPSLFTASSQDIGNLKAGKYQVKVSNTCGNKSLTVTLTEPTALVANISDQTNISCNGSSDGKMTVSATGGTPLYEYSWDNNTNKASANGLSAGTYKVTVTDANGCTAKASGTVIEPVPLDISTTIVGNTVTANATNVSYKWLDCDDLYAELSGEKNQDFIATKNGNYAVEVTSGVCVDTSLCQMVLVTGFSENYLEKGLSTYPNPTSGEFQIVFNDVCHIMKARIENASGILVNEIQLNNVKDTSLDIKGDPGLYFVHLNIDGKLETLKVIKN